MSNLTGKVAVITGSTGGMGEGIARRLAQDGASIVISGRRADYAERVARDIAGMGVPCIFARADVGEEADCVALIRATVERFGRIDILVNNAAATPVEPAGEQSAELWDSVFAVNTRGPWVCIREAIPHMRRQAGGNIVNIGSTMGYRGWLNRLAYATSKAALLAMTRTLARELARDRIRVNWVTVGWAATPNEVDLRTKTHGDGAAYLNEMNSKAPMGRLETVEDIAAGVAYLVSDQAGHVTGCELNISGGMFVHG